VTEFGAEMGQLWKSLSPADKAPYVEQAEADKERKREELDNRIRRPKSAYIFFIESQKGNYFPLDTEGQKWTVPEFGREMGAQWKSMSAAERAEFEREAAADRARYESEVAQYPEFKAPVRRKVGSRGSPGRKKSPAKSRSRSPTKRVTKTAKKSVKSAGKSARKSTVSKRGGVGHHKHSHSPRGGY
jgi:structure-specific recognition protein 1